jgi:GTP-binding protein HflX
VVVGSFLQERRQPDPAYLVGAGKVEELRGRVDLEQADLVVFDDDLTPAQARNLERRLETKVVDRSELILDIFAQRARSREGKLQVELAQLEYLLPRLTGKGAELSRLGGGIGTRGPGETRLEVDRRTIRRRIARLKSELGKLEQRRSLQRVKRQGVPVPTVSLVGYTNAGKSTLFNRLTSQNAYVSSRMFATLDPLVRRLSLSDGREALLSDTVGFIRKLPHTLVAAFHATLEEILEADLVVHVIDAAHEGRQTLRQAVYTVLDEIGFTGANVIEAYNKIDLVESRPEVRSPYDHVLLSARTGEGAELLVEKIASALQRRQRQVSLVIPLGRGDLLGQLRARARIESEEYREDGVYLQAALLEADVGRFQEFIQTVCFELP